MMTLTRREIEVLLDNPAQRRYVVSAYADMTVQDGFSRHVECHFRNEARAAEAALSGWGARKDLDANIEVIRQEIAGAPPAAKGLAIFSSVVQGLRHVVPLGFRVENHLIIDEEPFVLPLLECWYGEPTYLIALIDSDQAHLFEAHHGPPALVLDLRRDDADQEIQRDKPRFTYKKRFARSNHERLFGVEDDRFLHEAAAAVHDHFRNGPFGGVILLGQPPMIQPLRRLLPRDTGAAVVGEAPHAMTDRPEELAADVAKMIDRAQAERETKLLAELQERRKENHLVANGPTEVLDALQQGRATHVVFGRNRDLPGARCIDCGYRLGAAAAICPYCQGKCRTINTAQEILRMAMRHHVRVDLFRHATAKDDPLAACGGVAALLCADPHWAPAGASAPMS